MEAANIDQPPPPHMGLPVRPEVSFGCLNPEFGITPSLSSLLGSLSSVPQSCQQTGRLCSDGTDRQATAVLLEDKALF